MKTEAFRQGRRVVAVSGKHTVVLAMDWPTSELEGLLGFSIRRTDPKRKTVWLKTVLQFEGAPVQKGVLWDSSDAPIQSMIWSDFGLDSDPEKKGLPAGTSFVYEVIPVRGTPNKLIHDEAAAVRIAVSTEPEKPKEIDTPEVHFNRGLSSMQETERLFGEGNSPEGNELAMDWLARNLKTAIVDFVNQAVVDTTLKLDVAAYHLDEPAVLDAICMVGDRARVSLDWGPEEKKDDPGPNGPALKALTAAGVTVHKREHVSISHNKYMILAGADGVPKSVLTGSTNFTRGGIATQSNQSVIVRNSTLAKAYRADFERMLTNDNSGLREANRTPTPVGENLEVFFSPHSAGDRPDLDRLKVLAAAAKSSRLFMTFRMTDRPLISALLDDSVTAFGVADRVYHGTDESGDRLLFDEAHSAAPRVVAANFPLDDEPDEDVLFRELKREGFNPIIHHKVLLLDWDTPDCVVVTGSANYSTNSTEHNDENSLIVRGDMRLAEEYFVEFCRLFTHWSPRWLEGRDSQGASVLDHLAADASWTKQWATGGRPAEFLQMALGCEGKVQGDAAKGASDPGRASKASLAGERIEHVVVLMLENRSFDQMLGQLDGVDGVVLNPEGKDLEHVNYINPQDPTEEGAFPVMQATYFGIPEGDIPPPKIEGGKVRGLYGGPSHSFPSATAQHYNDSWGPAGSTAKGVTPSTNNGFVRSYDASLRRTYADWAKLDPEFKVPEKPLREHVEVAMASFSPQQLPVLSGLAQEFCVCDQWFSEVPGPTEPNRLFMHAATSVGLVHNPWSFPIDARTIYEDIDEDGEKTWGFYKFDLSDSDNFPTLKKRTDQIKDFESFAKDVQDPETFANYVFLCPRYVDSDDGFANSQHAPYDVRHGEHWIADVYEALRASPLWEKTLLVITYDEHGGFYDHVPPPSAYVLPPDHFTSPTEYDKKHAGYMFDSKGEPRPQYRFDFDRLGFRVPAVLVSPWISKGEVLSTQLQHTSVLSTVRKMWGLRSQPLTAREGQASDFDSVLEELSAPRKDCPMSITRPPLPETSLSAALDQPLSPVQREVFSQIEQLDGHQDSGQPAPMPKTQQEAAAYIRERRLAHNKHHGDGIGGFKIYTDTAGHYRWRLVDETTSEIVATSGQGFPSLPEVHQEIIRVKRCAHSSVTVEK